MKTITLTQTDPRKVWFISDTHILHENIVHNLGEGRPFTDMEHMVSTIRKNWWEKVQPDDTIFCVGDMAMGDIQESLKFFASLPGDKFLIPGNHDKLFSKKTVNYRARFQPLYEEVGFTVLDEIVKLVVPKPAGEGFEPVEVLLSHYPYSEPRMEGDRPDKYASIRPKDEGMPLIHGHTHSRERFSDNRLQFHIGVDANGFAPVGLPEIIDWLDTV